MTKLICAYCLARFAESHLVHGCRVLAAGRECATAFKALLELIHQIVLKPTPENKKKLPTFSKEVATSVGEVVQAAEAIRGGH